MAGTGPAMTPDSPRLILLGRSVIEFRHIFPVDEIFDGSLQVIGTSVAVVDVIGMFPDIDAEDGDPFVNERVFAVWGLGRRDLPVRHRQPAPAGTELRRSSRDQVLRSLLDRAE